MTRFFIIGGIILALAAAVGFQQWRLEAVLEENGRLAQSVAALVQANKESAEAVETVRMESRAREAAVQQRLAREQAEKAELAGELAELEGLADENAALRRQLDITLHPCLAGWVWDDGAGNQEGDCEGVAAGGLAGPDAETGPAGGEPPDPAGPGAVVQSHRPGPGEL